MDGSLVGTAMALLTAPGPRLRTWQARRSGETTGGPRHATTAARPTIKPLVPAPPPAMVRHTSGPRSASRRLARGVLLLGLLLSPWCAAGQAAAAQGHSTPSSITFFGLVEESQTGHPVPRAAVSSGALQVTTDSTGKYTLTIPYQPVIVLRATALGYQTTFPLPVLVPGVARQGVPVQFNFSAESGLRNAFHTAAGDTLTPFAQVVPLAQHTLILRGIVHTPLVSQAAVTLPNGWVRRFPLTIHGAAFAGQISFDHGPGQYDLEVLATTGLPLFLIPIYYGVPYAPQLVQVLSPSDSPSVSVGQLEATVLVALNALRLRYHLPLLASNAALAAVARAHGHDVATHHLFWVQPHSGSNGSTLAMRVRQAGIPFHLLAEGVAQVTAARDALRALADSPFHRAMLQDTHVSQVGIGVARCSDGKLIVTVDLLQP